MVAPAVRALGGVRTPSLARPMLESAYDAFTLGYRIEAAGRLREALRRHLAAECASHALDTKGDAATLLDRLRASGVAVSSFLGDALVECEEIIAMRNRGNYFEATLGCAVELIGYDIRQGGA